MHNSFPNTLESSVSLTDAKLKAFTQELFKETSPKKYAAISVPVSAVDPLLFLNSNWDSSRFQYYWEKPSEQFAIAAGKELLQLSASGKQRFQEISHQIGTVREATAEFSTTSLPYSGLMFLGGFSFFDTVRNADWASFKPALFSIPKWAIIRDGEAHYLTLFENLDSFNSADELHRHLIKKVETIERSISIIPSTIVESGSAVDFGRGENQSDLAHWRASIRRAKEWIDQDKFKKIVLARHRVCSVLKKASPTGIIDKLRQEYQSCYNFLIHRPENATFLGSTPERLASFRNHSLRTEALAGSIQRGETASEDALFERNLSDSAKDQHEHNFVVQDIEQRLQPFANIDRENEPEIRKLANVQHLYTPIRATLKRDVDIFSIVEELHPTPAVGGYPWKNAAPFLKKLEDFERGWYAGPVGWLNGKHSGEFAVGIRSGLLTESEAHFYAGCGIVSDSDADEEWKETNLKFQPMMSALQHG